MYDYSQFAPTFATPLEQMMAAAALKGHELSIRSGYRSPERQEQLWEEALKKYGTEAAARKWVAPPGKSYHNKRLAADLAYANEAAKQWAHANARRYGLHFPLSNEDWHIEPITARAAASHKHADESPSSQIDPTWDWRAPAPVEARLVGPDPVEKEIDWAGIADSLLQDESLTRGVGQLFGGGGGGGPVSVPSIPSAPVGQAPGPLQGVPLEFMLPLQELFG